MYDGELVNPELVEASMWTLWVGELCGQSVVDRWRAVTGVWRQSDSLVIRWIRRVLSG